MIFVIKNASGRRTIGKKSRREPRGRVPTIPVRLVQRDEVHRARGPPRLDRPSDESDVAVVDGGGARELHLLARRVDLLREIDGKCAMVQTLSLLGGRGGGEWGGDCTPMFQLTDGKMMFFILSTV